MLDDEDKIKIAIDNENVNEVKCIIREMGFHYYSWHEGYAPIYYALCNKKLECVEALLDAGPPIRKSEHKMNLILECITTGNSANVLQKILYQFPEQINQKDRKNVTPLQLVIQNNKEEFVEILIKNGASLDSAFGWGETPLEFAINRGNVNIVKTLLEHGAEFKIDHFHLAVHCLNKKLITFFIEKGIDINAKNQKGETALHLLCKVGMGPQLHEVLVYILDLGANPNVEDVKKNTPLFYAAHHHKDQLIRTLLERDIDFGIKANKSAAMITSSFNDLKMFEECLIKGFKFDAKNEDIEELLLRVLKQNSLVVLRKLLECGLDPETCLTVEATSMTLIQVAVMYKKLDCVKVLLSHGADINAAVKEEGWTPLLIAARDRQFEIFKQLMLQGADPNIPLTHGQKVLHFAATASKDFYEYVLQQNVQIDHRMEKSATALHWASYYGNYRAIPILIDHGADVNAAMTGQIRPLHLAIMKAHQETAIMLLNRGADINAQDSYSRTALHLAASKNLYSIVVALLLRDPNIQLKDKWGKTPIDIATNCANAQRTNFERVDVYKCETENLENELRGLFIAQIGMSDCYNGAYQGHDHHRDDFSHYKMPNESQYQIVRAFQRYSRLKENRIRIINMEEEDLYSLVKADFNAADSELGKQVLLMKDTKICQDVSLMDLLMNVSKEEAVNYLFDIETNNCGTVSSSLGQCAKSIGGVFSKFFETVGLKSEKSAAGKEMKCRDVLKNFTRSGFYPLLRRQIDGIRRLNLEQNVYLVLKEKMEYKINSDVLNLITNLLSDQDLRNFLKATSCYDEKFEYDVDDKAEEVEYSAW